MTDLAASHAAEQGRRGPLAAFVAGAVLLYLADVLYLVHLEAGGDGVGYVRASVLLGIAACTLYAVGGAALLPALLRRSGRIAGTVAAGLWTVFAVSTAGAHTVFGPVITAIGVAGRTSDAAWLPTFPGADAATETALWAFQVTAVVGLVPMAVVLGWLLVATLRGRAALPRWSAAFHPFPVMVVTEIGLRGLVLDDRGLAQALLPFTTGQVVYAFAIASIMLTGSRRSASHAV